jgi:hypothetical protein
MVGGVVLLAQTTATFRRLLVPLEAGSGRVRMQDPVQA